MQRKTLLAALIAILNGTAYQAHAYSVTVVASRPVEQQVVPRMEAIKGVLSDILSTCLLYTSDAADEFATVCRSRWGSYH